MNTFQVANYTIQMFSGAEDQNACIAQINIAWPGTVNQVIVRFFDKPYGEFPANGTYASDYNVSFPANALGGFLQMLKMDGIYCTVDPISALSFSNIPPQQ